MVVGGVFLYYFYDLRGLWEKNRQLSQRVGWGISAFVFVGIVLGFLVIGSPQTQRLIRFDQEKVNDLMSIQWQVVNFYQQKERLPETLEELEDPLIGFILPQDSQSKKEYGFVRISDLQFSLCADFNKESRKFSKGTSPAIRIESPVRLGVEDENWRHGVGETCFERTIDPDKFPPLKELRR